MKTSMIQFLRLLLVVRLMELFFSDNTPEIQIDDNNTMSIELFNGDNTLRLNI